MGATNGEGGPTSEARFIADRDFICDETAPRV